MNPRNAIDTPAQAENTRDGNVVLLPVLLSILIAALALIPGCSRERADAAEPIVTAAAPAVTTPAPAALEPASAPTSPVAMPDTTNDATPNVVVATAKADPVSVKGWVREGRAAMDAGDFGAALAAAERALEVEPESAPTLHLRGRALLALKRGDEALAALQAARERAPENGYIANTLGYALIQSGRAGEAVAHLEAAREKLPAVAYVRNNLGVAYERSGERAKAIDEYRAGVAAGDSEGKAAQSLARLGATVTPEGEVAASASASLQGE